MYIKDWTKKHSGFKDMQKFETKIYHKFKCPFFILMLVYNTVKQNCAEIDINLKPNNFF